MAAPPPPPFSTILGAMRRSIGSKYYNLATCVIILYDHSLTLDVEIEYVWKECWSFPKVLWFVFRYLTPFLQIGAVLADQLPTFTHKTCVLWLWVRVIGDDIITMSTLAILILRIWALFDRARWVIIFMICVLLGQFGAALWAFQGFSVTTQLPGFPGCVPVPKAPDRAGQVAALWISLLVMDTLIFLLTILRTAKLATKSSRSSPIVSVMFRDGVQYYLVICIVNLANVLLIDLPSVPTDLKALNTEFTPNITVILVSRLFLNLRATAKLTSDVPSTLLGNLGEPIFQSPDE